MTGTTKKPTKPTAAQLSALKRIIAGVSVVRGSVIGTLCRNGWIMERPATSQDLRTAGLAVSALSPGYRLTDAGRAVLANALANAAAAAAAQEMAEVFSTAIRAGQQLCAPATDVDAEEGDRCTIMCTLEDGHAGLCRTEPEPVACSRCQLPTTAPVADAAGNPLCPACVPDPAQVKRRAVATMKAKAAICDALARYYPRGLKPFEVQHHRGAGVLPPGINDPLEAAIHWDARAAEVEAEAAQAAEADAEAQAEADWVENAAPVAQHVIASPAAPASAEPWGESVGILMPRRQTVEALLVRPGRSDVERVIVGLEPRDWQRALGLSDRQWITTTRLKGATLVAQSRPEGRRRCFVAGWVSYRGPVLVLAQHPTEGAGYVDAPADASALLAHFWGDAECSSCGARYFSAEGHAKHALCPLCK